MPRLSKILACLLCSTVIIFKKSALQWFQPRIYCHCKQNYNQIKMQPDQSGSLLSQLSQISYHGPKQEYTGNDFFGESLPGRKNQKARPQNTDGLVDVEMLENNSAFMTKKTPNDNLQAFKLFWTSDVNHNIEGTSDNEEEPHHHQEITQKVQADKSGPIQPYSALFQPTSKPIQPKLRPLQPSFTQMDVPKSESCDSESLSNAIKNETKNIPKNYGKAIIIFIEKNRDLLEPIFDQYHMNHLELLDKLRNVKKKINTIADLRNLWASQADSKCLRIISNFFLRKHALHYIYNSRIKTRLCHAKYKKRLQEAILNPFEFNHIKDY